MMSRWSLTYIPCLVRLCITIQLCLMVMPEWISEHLVFGGCTVFDVRVFNSFAASNQSTTLAATFCRHEAEKRRAYEEHIHEVEYGSFTPLAFSSSGGMGKVATTTYKHLAQLLSEKWSSPYSVVMGWLRCSLGFSLLRSSIMCTRGSQSRSKCPGVPLAIDLAIAEGHLPVH